jgi:hypothetical protein
LGTHELSKSILPAYRRFDYRRALRLYFISVFGLYSEANLFAA